MRIYIYIYFKTKPRKGEEETRLLLFGLFLQDLMRKTCQALRILKKKASILFKVISHQFYSTKKRTNVAKSGITNIFFQNVIDILFSFQLWESNTNVLPGSSIQCDLKS